MIKKNQIPFIFVFIFIFYIFIFSNNYHTAYFQQLISSYKDPHKDLMAKISLFQNNFSFNNQDTSELFFKKIKEKSTEIDRFSLKNNTIIAFFTKNEHNENYKIQYSSLNLISSDFELSNNHTFYPNNSNGYTGVNLSILKNKPTLIYHTPIFEKNKIIGVLIIGIYVEPSGMFKS